MEEGKQLWEILVPAESNEGLEYSIGHHHEWDAHVRAISGGLTILKSAKGQWVDETGQLYKDKVIPVRIACTEPQIDRIMAYTIRHYGQKAVMAYLISEKVKTIRKEELKE